MSFTEITTTDPGLELLISQAVGKLDIYPAGADRRWLLVDVCAQRLIRVQGRIPLGYWPVSTAAAGLNNRQDSGGTPAGAHRIDRKIGADHPLGTVFVGRKPTGQVWQAAADSPDDLILTRILTLAGCEHGVNQGPGVDSRARYIYLHGTNHEHRIGEPVSGGCVRLTNADIRDVFDQIEEGDPVVII